MVIFYRYVSLPEGNGRKKVLDTGAENCQAAVVLVGRLGQARLVGLLGDGLAVGHHGVADDEVALGVLVLP